MRYFLLTMWALFAVSTANYPVFEGTTQLKRLLVPADVHIGSVIYRLRASDHDHDYPLQFDATDYGSYVVKVENLPCNVNSTMCEANVYLDRVLVGGQNFQFRFTVRDTKGDTTTALVSIEVTNAPVDITTIFPHMPGIIVIPEDTKVGTELEYVIVRKHPEHKKEAYLEIRSSPVLDFGRMRTSKETITGVITLVKKVDFETRNMYKLQIFALDMYTDKLVDSRNIAGFDLLLIVEDVQDSPPEFIQVEPTIKLRSNLTQSDVITKVTAVDGDRGNPRQIKYGLVSEGNPFTIFFNIDRIKGELSLARPLKQLMAITRSHQPILLTIIAEEEKLTATKDFPSMSTTVTIALLLDEAGNTPPYFDNDHYVCYLNENSPQGTALVFSDAYSAQVHDDDVGKQGVFSLLLDKNNGTFEISPNVVERKAYFTIRVRNKQLLDYEARQSVQFVIVARELDPGSLSSSASVLVYLNDVNDNGPQFQKTVYMAQIPENATANTFVVEVKATDVDTGLFGRVHYTRISGYRNSSLLMNSVTGVITVATDYHGFDREESAEYQMTVEARDMEGTGLLATTSLILHILDVNDETPRFENTQYQFTLTADMKNFSTQAFIKATDKDAEAPNNVVRYEIISGNYDNKFSLNSETGELTVRYSNDASRGRERRQAPVADVHILTVRAYDLGVPHRWSTVQVKIFPPDSGTRLLNFLLPANGLDYTKMEELLTKMTGGQVSVLEVNPYRGSRYRRAVTEMPKHAPSQEKNMVVARVTYADNSVIDIEQIYHLMQPVFSNTVQKDQVELQTASSSSALYWIIVIFILLLIAMLIVALLCYLCKCCPCMAWDGWKRHKKKNQVSGSMQTVDFINKGVQANNRVGTWSSSSSNRPKRSWNFYNQREPKPHPQPVLLIPKNTSPGRRHYRNITTNEDGPPAVIYRSNLAEISTMDQHGDIFIHDVAETEYRILDPAKLNVRRLHEHETVNLEKAKPRDLNTPIGREESFVREGNAEILRLQTHETDPKPDRNSFQWFSNAYEPQPVLLPGDTGSRHSKLQTSPQEDTTTLLNFPAMERSAAREDLPSLYKPTAAKPKHQQQKPKVANGVLRTDMSQPAASEPPETSPTPVSNPAVPEAARISQANAEPREMIRDLMDASHLEDERNRLASVQRDLLLTRLLVEEQRRCLLNQASGDTLSLPGSLSMAIQTDRHRATQTDLLCMMRPEPRRVKSENDDSSDSDGDCLTSTRRISRRTFCIIGKDKSRHKIRTPIIEESESTEISRHSSKPLQRENRSSLLRLSNNRNRIKEIIVNGRVKKYNQVILKQSKLQKCPTDHKLEDREVRHGGHVSLKDTRKAVSFSNINDACVLSDKEIYTPRSLKSRLIARRLSASEPPKIGAHCMSHKQQEKKERQKADLNDACAAEWSKRAEEKHKGKEGARHRLRHQKQAIEGEKENVSPSRRSRSREATAEKDADGSISESTPSPGTAATATLKLKGKNQQLMEKKSVFTIAYDDATTEHLEASSNGSNHE